MEVSIIRMSGRAEFYNEIAKDALKIRMDSSLTVFGYQTLKKVSSHLRRHFQSKTVRDALDRNVYPFKKQFDHLDYADLDDCQPCAIICACCYNGYFNKKMQQWYFMRLPNLVYGNNIP